LLITLLHPVLHRLGQIPLGPVPRNFLVANVTRKLRGTGPSGIWPFPSYRAVLVKFTLSLGYLAVNELVPRPISASANITVITAKTIGSLGYIRVADIRPTLKLVF